mmetsp:Transcript_60710/g.131565  ORF Transcript_60710/g.131565 Transcript_60710/m.131565 type:complete len:441 (-) Transcript_60710:337-1659(-)
MGCAAAPAVAPPEPQVKVPVQPVAKPSHRGSRTPELAEKSQSLSDKFHKHYRLIGKLGKGAFAQVHLASKVDTNCEYAVKIVDLRNHHGPGMDDSSKKACLNEIALLKLIGSEQRYCVASYEFFIDESFSYMVMERCPKTLLQLFEGMAELTEHIIGGVLKDILLGLSHVHDIGIVHRDVKPDNFLCGADCEVKLCDFGLAELRVPKTKQLQGVFGTAPFMSPEMLLGKRYDDRADVWSVGAVAHVLLCGNFPYIPAEASAKAMKAVIARGVPAPTFMPTIPNLTISEQASMFIRTLLNRDAVLRPTAQEALRHPFMDKALDSSHRKSSMEDFLKRSRAKANSSSKPSLRSALHSAKKTGAFDARGWRVTDDRGMCALLEKKQHRFSQVFMQSERTSSRGSSSHEEKARRGKIGDSFGSTEVGSSRASSQAQSATSTPAG